MHELTIINLVNFKFDELPALQYIYAHVQNFTTQKDDKYSN
jgi:hypothetical protein